MSFNLPAGCVDAGLLKPDEVLRSKLFVIIKNDFMIRIINKKFLQKFSKFKTKIVANQLESQSDSKI